MSHRSYQRGSALIASTIQRDYQASLHAQQQRREVLSRVFSRVEQLEKYALLAQEYFIDATVEPVKTGLVASSIRERYEKTKTTRKVKTLLDACVSTHCVWVDVDRRDLMALMQAALNKAIAWKQIYDHLNPAPSFRLPFDTPRGLSG